ncbi:hypothetical protein Gotur_011570 [Gossypium turneri]
MSRSSVGCYNFRLERLQNEHRVEWGFHLEGSTVTSETERPSLLRSRSQLVWS